MASGRNICRHIFSLICALATLSMVGYWLYKFEVEDRDIGVVDYQSLETSVDVIEYPAVTFCFFDPFLAANLYPNNTKINRQNYLRHLRGEVLEEKYKSIDYQNVTLSLDSYFLYNEVKFVQETTFQNSSLKTLHKENFNGIYDGNFGKCFELQFYNKPDRHLREIKIIYDYQQLYADLEPEESLDLWLFTHHPGQFLLATQDPTHSDTTYNVHYLWINDLEILNARNSRKRNCHPAQDGTSFDDLVMQAHIRDIGCRVPYLKPFDKYPICCSKKELEDGSYQYERVKHKYYPPACHRISKIGYSHDYEYDSDRNDTLTLHIIYPFNAKIITQAKEVDIHTLIGNIGGYVGLFLGSIYLNILALEVNLKIGILHLLDKTPR